MDKAQRIADKFAQLCRQGERRKTTGYVSVRLRMVNGQIRTTHLGIEKQFRPDYEESLTFQSDGLD